MKIRTRFDRVETGLSFTDSPSLTQQQFKNTQDVNNMVQRFLRGDMSVVRPRINSIQDASGLPASKFDAMCLDARARSTWEGLPDHVKQSYGNIEGFLASLNRAIAADKEAAEKAEAEKAAAAKAASEEPKPGVTSEGGGAS